MSKKQKSKAIDFKELKKISALDEETKRRKEILDKELAAIIKGEDTRLLLIIGPCSAHDEEAVMEYCLLLSSLQKKVKDKIFIVPRIYTNKPRTNGEGYKGLLHHPNPENQESNLFDGILAVRRLHQKVITQTGLITADEMLYPENFAAMEDLVSYHAIGARSVEDQQHRFVASGIDSPVGMKNPTSGNISVMLHAIYAAQQKQTFLYNAVEIETTGNPLAHVILRGSVNAYGESTPNFHYEDLLKTIKMYQKSTLEHPFILVDANHDNSGKQYLEQIRVVKEVLLHRDWNKEVKKYVRGFMVESYLEDGRKEPGEKSFGKSITDPCLGWEKTERLIQYIYENLSSSIENKKIF